MSKRQPGQLAAALVECAQQTLELFIRRRDSTSQSPLRSKDFRTEQ
jgi:hypothetical protein